jgi:ATP-dependent Clp protease ATP-binding subunit ClpA
MVLVVDKFIEELRTQLSERKIQIELDGEARSWLARAGYDPDFGARPLSRVIQEQLKDRISDEILFGILEKGGIVRVSVEEEILELSFEGPG